MKCPFCKHNGTDVIDSRQLNSGELVKRRRQCNSCKERFTTHEIYSLSNNNKISNKRDIYQDLKRIHDESSSEID